MSRHYNIPVFVPHYGCPFSCVFCNQNAITGRNSETDINEAGIIIENQLSTIKDGDIEIAFFGGSFTAIPKEIMLRYLNLGKKYIDSGRVRGIRISTRPDFINGKILDVLKSYGVTTIELGAQSFDNEVLRKSGRGHAAEETISACRLINSYGCFNLGIQLMTGLPGDTEEKSVHSAEIAAELKPSQVRIYPTLVIRGTAMEKMYRNGSYSPQTTDEAITTAGKMLEIFERHNISVIRVGLSSIEDMNRNGDIIAGPVHPALRELCEGNKYLVRLEKIINSLPDKPVSLTISAPASEFSKIIGHKKCNAIAVYKKYGIKIHLKISDSFSVKPE